MTRQEKHKHHSHDVGNSTTKQAPIPLRIPVDKEKDDYEDGSLYADELLDEIPEVESFDDNGVEGVDFVKATIQQEMAGKLWHERQARLQVMQDKANLEHEISVLRKEVAETRIQRLKDEAASIMSANAQMFADVGLRKGDQLKPTDEGFIVIPKKTENS